MSLLATQGLTIRFGGHVAVNNVTCAFGLGTLTAIVGPNGAGKTTYFNRISASSKATSGPCRWTAGTCRRCRRRRARGPAWGPSS